MFKLKITLACFVFALYGCCTQPEPRPTRLQYLTDLQEWQLDGRIAITSDTHNVNAAFAWTQTGKNYRIHFTSPYSTETLTILGQGDDFKAISNDDEKATSELELEKDLPFKQLASWLKGVPYPGSSVQIATYDKAHHLKTLQQDNWSIEYQSYLPSAPYAMPAKLTIINGTTKVKLLIKNWQK